MKKTIALILMMSLLLVCPAAAGAEAGELTASFQASGLSLTLQGSFPAAAGAAANCLLLPEGMEADGLTERDFEDGVCVARPVPVGGDGRFTSTTGLYEDMPSGEYRALLTYGGTTLTAAWICRNDSLLEPVSKQLSAAASQAEFIKTAERYSGVLGFGDSTAEMAEWIYHTKKDLLAVYQEAFVIRRIRLGELDGMLQTYGADYGISYSGYLELTDAARGTLQTLFQEREVFDLKAEYPALLGDARYTACRDYAELQALIETLDWNLTAYHSLSKTSQESVCKQLYRRQCRTLDAAKKEFDALVSSYGRDASNSSSGGSHSGGGGGGGGGSYAASVPDPAPPESEATPTPSERFPDLDGHWAKETVLRMAERGIVRGYEDGSFRPDAQVTRAEFVKLACEALGVSGGQEAVFSDVMDGDWFAPYVNAMAGAGLIQGFAGEFRPGERITREDMAVIAARMLEAREVSLGGSASFLDEGDISDYARSAVMGLAAAGYLTGSDGAFYPLDFTTRAEAATVISRLLQ